MANENSENGSVIRVSAGIVVAVLMIICSLIAAIYYSLNASIDQVKADTNARFTSDEIKYDTQQSVILKISNNIAIICATVANGKCQP